MKISGFTFCRNAIKYDYPIAESIQSILPIVDEFIVNVGKSEDETLKLIQSIGDPKIRIIKSVWDESLKKDGLIFSQQTNIALRQCTGDWAFYLQADEVVHEDDLPGLVLKMREALAKPNILGLSFRYLHFYGDYYSINPWFYHRAVRIIRNNGEVESFGDAVGFCNKSTNEFLHPQDRRQCLYPGARVFHYGYVKDPRVLVEKVRYQASRHHGDEIPEEQARKLEKERYEFDQYDILKEFRGSHPRVMSNRLKGARHLLPRRNRWLNPRFYRYVLQHGFKG
jgi:glycosyltransferase involved in cell wall biosynthesis